MEMGPPLDGNWQFLIDSPDTTTTIDFYKRVLLSEGYSIRENVSVVLGANTINYDLAFFGKTFGSVSDFYGGTAVTVDDDPILGLDP